MCTRTHRLYKALWNLMRLVAGVHAWGGGSHKALEGPVTENEQRMRGQSYKLEPTTKTNPAQKLEDVENERRMSSQR